MTDSDVILLASEVADLLRCTPSQVRTLWRQGLLDRIPPQRPPRYTRASVDRILEGYYVADAQSHRETKAQEAPPRRGNRRPTPGPLAGATVGGGGAVPRRIGPSETDVVVRRVPR